MYRPSIYFAGKMADAAIGRELYLTDNTFTWDARWVWIEGEVSDSSIHAAQFWAHDRKDVANADALVLWALDPKAKLRGALIEAGMALALDKPVLALVSPGGHPDLGTWRTLIDVEPLAEPTATAAIPALGTWRDSLHFGRTHNG